MNLNNTLLGALGIEITENTPERCVAVMPVDKRTVRLSDICMVARQRRWRRLLQVSGPSILSTGRNRRVSGLRLMPII